MSGPQPRTDQRLDLISRIAPLVCCPSDQTGCEESDFCTTLEENPQNFTFQNANEFCDWFVSPSKSNCSTLSQDIQNFISTTPQCAQLSNAQRESVARSFLQPFSSADANPFVQQSELVCSMNNTSGVSVYNSQEGGCRQAIIDYQKSRGLSLKDSCMGMNVDDLGKISTFCQGVSAAVADRPAPPPPPSEGIDWLGSGAIATGVATAILYIKRFIKIIRQVGKEAENAGEVIGLFTKGLRAVNKEAKTFLREVRRFFGDTLVDVGRTLKYIFTGAWFRKKKPVDTTNKNETAGAPRIDEPKETAADPAKADEEVLRKMRQTSPELRPVVPEADAIRGTPLRSVVIKQLDSMRDDPVYEQAGALFGVQKKYVQLYLSELAINRWHLLSSQQREEYTRNDTLPLRGALPNDYIKWFASKYLAEEGIAKVHSSAIAWAKEEAQRIGDKEVAPAPDVVKNQLLSVKFFENNPNAAAIAAPMAVDAWLRLDLVSKATFIDIANPPKKGELPIKFIDIAHERIDKRELASRLNGTINPNFESITDQFIRDTRLSTSTSQYMALLAIERWRELDEQNQANFIEPDRVLHAGEVPWLFIRWFKRSINRAEIGKLGNVYGRLMSLRPELKQYEFSIINARVVALYSAWNNLPPLIKNEFGEGDLKGSIPTSFLELMRTFLRVGTMPRERISPASEPWEYDEYAQPIIYDRFNVTLIMKILVQENSDLAMYPSVLESRARALVDDWGNLPENIKHAFKAQDKRNGSTNGDVGIPITFVRVWYRINGGIGVTGRTSMAPDDDPDKNRGGGGNTGGSGGSPIISGFTPSGETSGTSGVSGVSSRSMLTAPAPVPVPAPAPVIAGGIGIMQPTTMSLTAMFVQPAPFMGILNYTAVPAGL